MTFNFTKADYIFTDIYRSLVENHDKEFIVDMNILGEKSICSLKKILNDENVLFKTKGSKLICYLSDKNKKIAESIYTKEVNDLIKKEEDEFIKEFMY